ncbi:MAG TPA: sensor histidine kinase [Ktedonobacterales bacterium]|nr:sensor histidine kinase [Ktedonobacterales bacterium]
MRSSDSPRAGAHAEGISPYLLWMIWMLWLFFLWQPVSAILTLSASPRKVFDLGAMALFTGLYLWITWQEAWRLSRPTPVRDASLWKEWGPLAVMLALSVALTLIAGLPALGSLIYVSAALCGRLSARWAIVAVVGLTLLAMLLSAIIAAPISATGQLFFIVPAVGLFVYFFGQAVRTNQELRRARQEIARLAVTEERLRFARDLHDLLGHTLSLIALKSELARRLVSVAPEQAMTEIGDVETAARQALIEVREAVSGYRQTTLRAELDGAHDLLAAAGVALTVRGDLPPLAPSAEAALSWAVREGVTNVIRHSTARSCAVTLAERDGRVSAEVRDDGAARTDDAEAACDRVVGVSSGRGAGLAGLRERVTALGGVCEAGAAATAGWRLMVALPTGSKGADATSAAEGETSSPGGAQAEARRETRITTWFG